MLTAAQIDAAPIPPHKPRRLYDGTGAGLYLIVMPSGSKGWRLQYTFAGKSSTKSFGAYPEVSPEVARERCKAFRAALESGQNPVAVARVEKEAAAVLAAATFGRVGLEFLKHDDTLTARTRVGHMRYLNHLKKFHARTLASITTKELVDACRVIENKGNRETAHRVASFADRVYRYAAQSGLCDVNPAGQMRGALKPVLTVSRAGVTDPKYFGSMMRWIDGDTSMHATVRHALRLLARIFVRPGELRQLEWSHVDLAAAEIKIPASIMKMDRPHWVPLAPACVDILKAQKEISGDSLYVFPGTRVGRVISDGTLNAALKALFILPTEHVPHGFRVTASTMLHELGYEPAVIEAQLAHEKANDVAKVYNRAAYQPERRAMMDRWCGYIEELKAQT